MPSPSPKPCSEQETPNLVNHRQMVPLYPNSRTEFWPQPRLLKIIERQSFRCHHFAFVWPSSRTILLTETPNNAWRHQGCRWRTPPPSVTLTIRRASILLSSGWLGHRLLLKRIHISISVARFFLCFHTCAVKLARTTYYLLEWGKQNS